MSLFDVPLFLALNATPATPEAVIATARWLSQDLPVFAGLMLLLELARGLPFTRRAVVMALLSMLIAWCTVRGFRSLLPIPRPAELGLGMQWIEQGARAGFPSMHAAAAFALMRGLMAGLGRGTHPAWQWLAYGTAAAVAWSRVCLGVHMPSDVVAGALVGLASAWLARQVLRTWISQRGRSSAYWFRRVRPSALRR
ncbi:phosphatase PAP2 family protein [Paracidovorax avenae]|uniref:phosphatase PAP2 family protein n=1 Tax=Paracidovorax avenae TaxID=80867 RepID=UPI000D1650E4|nr:phosphatase PAP2 family protein [Paracidovorax avenae]AVS90057.1 phosphatase PAP2 family protein [Paracidovorax avenae]